MAIAGFRLKTAVKSSGSIDDGGVRFDPMLRGSLTECTYDVMVAIHIMPSYKHMSRLAREKSWSRHNL